VEVAVAVESGLQASVTAAVLAAAVAHATWNAIAHSIKDKLVAMALVGGGGAICAAPLAAFAPVPATAAWPYLGASVAVHMAYNLGLMQSYKLGDFSQTYPLARGTAPLVVTVLAAVFVGEMPTPTQALGVMMIFLALSSLALTGRATAGRSDRLATAAAIGTGLTIAAYTVIDGVGVRRSGNAAGYVGWLILLEGGAVAIAAILVRRGALVEQLPTIWMPGLAAGGISLTAYGLVLWAQTRGALAPISALRETSIIAGALIGTIVFHERFGRARVIASAFVAAGIVLLSI
jgi:drug/metabolite transporter (DMT)-like permease